MARKIASKKKPGLISKLIWLLNIFFAIVLLATYLSSYVHPDITTLFGFLGLAYPFILLANILFGLFWLIRGSRKLLLPLFVIIIGFNPMVRHIQIFPGREAPADSASFKVLSYNVKNMANSNVGIVKAEIRDSIERYISFEEADITCLQEYSAKGGDFVKMFGELSQATAYPECYYMNYIPAKNYRIDALVILSKFPILNSGHLSIPGSDHVFGIYTDLLLHNDTIRLYNLHLESIRLKNEDYQFVEEITSGQAEKERIKEGSKSIVSKLSNAFKIRANQADVVSSSLAECPYPVVICGDFNDTPLSYSYHKISSDLNDAFVEGGHGLGNTFAGNLPPLRIDFILYSDCFNAYDFSIHDILLSDHYPVSAYLKMK